MQFEHWNWRNFEGSLGEVLKNCYSLSELGALYNDILRPVLGQVTLPRPRKEIMIREIAEVLNSPVAGKRFFEASPPKVRTVLGLLAWDGDRPLLELEETVGFPISKVEIIEPRYVYERARTCVVCLPEFSSVAFELSDSWGYSSALPKKGLTARLPRALRTCLRKFIPPPKGYHFEPLERPPEGVLTYRCDETFQEDARMVSDYISRGHLQRLATGKIKKSCVRALCEMTRGGEFFSGAAISRKLELLRINLLADLLAATDGKIRKAMLAEPPDPQVILREFLAEAFKKTYFFHVHLLSHLKSSDLCEDYLDTTPKNLWAIFSRLSPTGWVTMENLSKYQNYREIPLDLFCDPCCSVTVDYKMQDPYPGSRQRVDLSFGNEQDFLITPLLQGTAFLLASLGLAEIAYTLPEHRRWQRGGEAFLTPWDGLSAVRLTPLGAYAFRQTDEVTLSAVPRKRAEIFLNPNRLTVTSRNIDPVTELSLLGFMEKLCDGCYRMTRKSFLRGCTTDDFVQARIRQFKANIAESPPPAWQKFLDHLSLGVVALRCKSSYKVYALTDIPELRRHFATDPVLKEKTLKVEGLKVAISKTELPAVTQRLAELGYLLQ